MKLVLDLPASWTMTPTGAEVSPGVVFRGDELRPLPFNLEAWRDTTLARGVDPGAQRLVAAVERQTEAGWPVTLVVTEAGTIRRMHAFYRFLVYGCVAVSEGEARAFDAVMDEVKNVLLTGRPDFSAAHPIAIREVFAGFGPEPEVDDRGPPEG